MLVIKYNSIFWEQNEKMGHRQIKISLFSKDIAVLNASRTDSVWRCTFVPLGFSFTEHEMQELQKCISCSEQLMKMMVLDDFSTTCIDKFIEGL